MQATRQRVHWSQHINLVYLAYLVFQPAFDPDTTVLAWTMLGLALTLFLSVYFWSIRQRGRKLLWGMSLMAALGLLYAPFNIGALVFFIYAAWAAGRAVPRPVARRLIALLLGLVVAAAVLGGLHLMSLHVSVIYALFSFVPSFFFTGIIGALSMAKVEREQANAKLRMAQEEVEHLATVAERERIARDLHDLLGHTLSVITLKSELAAKLAPRDPVKAAAEMAEVERISRQALQQVREAVRGYRSQGLQAELVSAKMALEAAGLKLEYYAEPLDLTPMQESVLSLALREAVTNVVRHAQASRCVIRLAQDAAEVRLEVSDDGIGGEAPEGTGLRGMRERVAALGGRVSRDSADGTRLSVTLPKRGAVPEPLPPDRVLQLEPT